MVLKVGDVLPDTGVFQVGPIPVGLLTLDGGGALRQATSSDTYLHKPLTSATIAAFKSDMAAGGLQVCDAADGAPYDFGKAGFPLSLWVKKIPTQPPDGGTHPDLTVVYKIDVALSWGRWCILPAGGTTFNASYSYLVPITLKYGKIGDIASGSASVPFGGGGGTTNSAWGTSGFNVTGNPGTAYTPNGFAGGTPRWFLNTASGSPYYGYYQVDPTPNGTSGTYTWSGAPYPDPVGLFCADNYTMVVLVSH